MGRQGVGVAVGIVMVMGLIVVAKFAAGVAGRGGSALHAMTLNVKTRNKSARDNGPLTF
jgi:hypothetical protein